MKTKEAILDSLNFGNRPVADKAMEAMDIYAKEVAIAFAEWITDSNYKRTGNGGWWKSTSVGNVTTCEHRTTEELFNLFLLEQSAVK